VRSGSGLDYTWNGLIKGVYEQNRFKHAGSRTSERTGCAGNLLGQRNGGVGNLPGQSRFLHCGRNGGCGEPAGIEVIISIF